jgi:hypothetical protein
MATHIFVDNSNIIGGAQRAAKTIEPGVPWYDVRVYFRNFFSLLEHGEVDIRTRVLGGSVPPGNGDLWEYAREAGYDTNLLRKVEADDGRLLEQGVDELIHLKIANLLLDYSAPQTLILGTGDGRPGQFGTSFRDQAVRALNRGWSVRVFSWREQLSNRLRNLVCNTVDMKIHELDSLYHNLTFTAPVGITSQGRVVRKLTLPPIVLAAKPSSRAPKS